jgi:Replication-relaxation
MSLRIPEKSSELLASLGEHRVLSTSQVRAIHFPGRSPRRVQQALSHLERAGLSPTSKLAALPGASGS